MGLKQKTCDDCSETFDPTNGAQKRCQPCRLKRIAPDGLSRDLVLRVHGPDGSMGRPVVLPPAYLRKRGRMAEDNPGDWLAPVLPLRRLAAPLTTYPLAS